MIFKVRYIISFLFSKIIALFLAPIFRALFLNNVRYNVQKDIYIFDIDNTIADTWPSLIVKYHNEKSRLLNLPFFQKIKEILLRLDSDKNVKLIFMTARHYRYFFITYRWLKNLGLSVNYKDVIIVSNPAEKLWLLKRIKTNKLVYYFDDLSYNHENGEIKFYHQEIKDLENLPFICHIGYHKIKEIHNSK